MKYLNKQTVYNQISIIKMNSVLNKNINYEADVNLNKFLKLIEYDSNIK